MKSVVVRVEEEILGEVRTMLVCKNLTGTFYGALDEFALLVVQALDRGDAEITIYSKEKKGHG